MKYMGSKRGMLLNGLGELLCNVVPRRRRFFDLFCGTGVVGGFVASRFRVRVVASDLQRYAVVLAAPQVEGAAEMDPSRLYDDWFAHAAAWLGEREWVIASARAVRPQVPSLQSWRRAILASREECSYLTNEFPLSLAYGGYYFSPAQAVWFDALRATLPATHTNVALAALVQAASSCAASPGHTAQPLGLGDAAIPHIAAAWSRDPGALVHRALTVSARHSVLVKGHAVRADATDVAGQLSGDDLAFIDPPYSEAQYSRFYHVLEAVASGSFSRVEGTGRYPPRTERPQSRFCRLTESAEALNELLLTIVAMGAQAIVTFPAGAASNGLSGSLVESIADQYFRVKSKTVSSLFSTLGGNKRNRRPRHAAVELVLHLIPR
jgi:adenine-specific DNA-methyltransferase